MPTRSLNLGFSSIWLLGVVIYVMFVGTPKCLKNIHKQILAKVLLGAQSLAVFTLEADYKFEKGYPLDNSYHADTTSLI